MRHNAESDVYLLLRSYRWAGRNDGGARGAQFPGRRIIMGAPNHCGGLQKSQQFHIYFFQYSKFAFERPQVRTRGRQNCFLLRAQCNLATPLAAGQLWLAVNDCPVGLPHQGPWAMLALTVFAFCPVKVLYSLIRTFDDMPTRSHRLLILFH